MSSQHASQPKAVAALLVAATFWGMIWYPLRWLEHHGLPGLWSTLVIFSGALAVGLPLLWRERLGLLRRPGLFLLIALASGWCNTAFILAVLDGAVVRVMLLFYMSPLWAILLGRIVLGERLTPVALGTVVLAVSGALVILWDEKVGVPWPQSASDWLAISSGITFALSNVLARKGQDMSIPLKTVATWVGVVFLAGCWSALSATPWPAVAPTVIAAALALGTIGVAVMTVGVMYGVTHLPVYRSAVILLFEVIVGAVSAWWLAGEAIGLQEWLGGSLILLAGWWAAMHARWSAVN